jgi:hypothetical protein
VVAVPLEGWELQEEVLAPGEGLRPEEEGQEELEALEVEEF